MSEDKRKILTDVLTQLDIEDRVWAINYLVQLLVDRNPRSMKTRVVKKKYHNSFTDEDWEKYFEGQTTKDIVEDDMPVSVLLHGTAGKTIKPLKKWL